MTCSSCGEQPKNAAKDFTRAVVEINNPETLILFRKVVIPTSMGTEEETPAAIGKYHNVLLVYEANNHAYLYSSDGIPTLLSSESSQEVEERINELSEALSEETTNRQEADTELIESLDSLSSNLTAETTERANADTALNNAISAEVTARQSADNNLQGQIDAITANSDVKDIVGTKAELNNYDTSTLGNNDIIKVLQDESESNATTYYRWNSTTQQFTLIGSEGPYYTKSQADTLLNAKQNTLTAGANVQIVGDTISATDTTYTAGNGLDLSGTEFSVDTTTIAEKSDIPAVVQTTGSSTTDVMSQNATTKMVFANNNNKHIAIGNGATTGTTAGNSYVAIGNNSTASGSGAVAIKGEATGVQGVAIGDGASASATATVALGAGANASTKGMIDVSTSLISSTAGYNNTSYRLLSGLHDPVNAQDAATKGYVDTTVAASATPVVQTIGASTTDVMSQKAASELVFRTGNDNTRIQIGQYASVSGDADYQIAIGVGALTPSLFNNATAIGHLARANNYLALAIGSGISRERSASASGVASIALGTDSRVTGTSSVAFAYGEATTDGQFDIGASRYNSGQGGGGYNGSGYRLLTGVYDPQSAHDAATKGYADGLIPAATFTTNEWNALWA